MMRGLVVVGIFAVLAVIIATTITAIGRFAAWVDSDRPPLYRGRHRPSPAHPVHAAWLDMQRLDDADIAAEHERGMAAIDAMLEEQSR